MLKYRVQILESERGWGQNILGHYYFKTSDEMQNFIREYNKDMVHDHVPDYYIIAREDGYADVPEELTED